MAQPEIMTLLRDVLEVARLAKSRVTRAELVPPWGLEIDPCAELALHMVQRGSCWLHTESNGRPTLLNEGDIALIREGTAHSVTDKPNSPTLPYQQALDLAKDRALTLPATDKTTATRILCAKYAFEQVSQHPLLTALPSIAIVTTATVKRSRQLHLLTQLLDAEADEALDGQELLLPRLVDSLLILVLRSWIAHQEGTHAGWVAALRSPEVARALSSIHERPQEAWTVEELAQSVGQSRATFNRHFVELVGEPPAAYLARWRMSLTAHLLLHSELPLEAIAPRVGYESAAALSKAFRRARGVAPGRFRTEGAASGTGSHGKVDAPRRLPGT